MTTCDYLNHFISINKICFWLTFLPLWLQFFSRAVLNGHKQINKSFNLVSFAGGLTILPERVDEGCNGTGTFVGSALSFASFSLLLPVAECFHANLQDSHNCACSRCFPSTVVGCTKAFSVPQQLPTIWRLNEVPVPCWRWCSRCVSNLSLDLDKYCSRPFELASTLRDRGLLDHNTEEYVHFSPYPWDFLEACFLLFVPVPI